jgi:hypothetical protein
MNAQYLDAIDNVIEQNGLQLQSTMIIPAQGYCIAIGGADPQYGYDGYVTVFAPAMCHDTLFRQIETLCDVIGASVHDANVYCIVGDAFSLV